MDEIKSKEAYYMSIDEDTVVKAYLEKILKIKTLDGVEESINVYNFDSDNGRKLFGVFNSENNRGLHFGSTKISSLIREIENRGYKVVK